MQRFRRALGTTGQTLQVLLAVACKINIGVWPSIILDFEEAGKKDNGYSFVKRRFLCTFDFFGLEDLHFLHCLEYIYNEFLC